MTGSVRETTKIEIHKKTVRSFDALTAETAIGILSTSN